MERYSVFGKDECHGLFTCDWHRRGERELDSWHHWYL
jgi:hypothetical protein